MGYSLFGLNAKLTGITSIAAGFSLHTAYSFTGNFEVTGSPYVRIASTWGTVANGQVTGNGQTDFLVPPTTTFLWVGLQTSTTAGGGNFLGMWPLFGDPKEFFVDTASGVIFIENHLLSQTFSQQITFANFRGTAWGSITEGGVYWTRDITANTFKFTATAPTIPGTNLSTGTAVGLSTRAPDSTYFSRIEPETTSAAGGTFTLQSVQLDERF